MPRLPDGAGLYRHEERAARRWAREYRRAYPSNPGQRCRWEAVAMATIIGVVKESDPDEHRVAVVPAVVARLRGLGCDVLVENDAGAGAFLPDSAYTEVGAAPVGAAELFERADVLVCVRAPTADRVARM